MPGWLTSRGLTGLIGLFVAGTRVTDDGVLDLERRCPGSAINRDEEMFAPTTMTRLIADLEFARSQPFHLARLVSTYRAQGHEGAPR